MFYGCKSFLGPFKVLFLRSNCALTQCKPLALSFAQLVPVTLRVTQGSHSQLLSCPCLFPLWDQEHLAERQGYLGDHREFGCLWDFFAVFACEMLRKGPGRNFQRVILLSSSLSIFVHLPL